MPATHQWCECLLDVCALCLKLCWVIVVDLLKGLAAISKVTGVDADLVSTHSTAQHSTTQHTASQRMLTTWCGGGLCVICAPLRYCCMHT
jgi:hypothetical protein